MKALVLCAGAFCCAIATPAAARNEPVSLPKTSKWVMDYDTDSCRLLSSFGTGKDAITLIFTRYAPTDSFYLDVIGEQLSENADQAEVMIDFGPATNPRRITASVGHLDKIPALLGMHDDLLDREPVAAKPPAPRLPAILPEQEAAVTYVTIQQRLHKALRLELGSMRAPMQAMRACTDDLLKSWKLDPAVQSSLNREAMPIGSPARWLSSSDYPIGMLFEGAQGLVQFRLDIDENGAVSGCHIQGHTKPEGFTDLTCQLIARRARFMPALDASGKPAKSVYVNRVRWIIPGH